MHVGRKLFKQISRMLLFFPDKINIAASLTGFNGFTAYKSSLATGLFKSFLLIKLMCSLIPSFTERDVSPIYVTAWAPYHVDYIFSSTSDQTLYVSELIGSLNDFTLCVLTGYARPTLPRFFREF